MKGTLTEQPLAELIREISSRSLSGTLRLEHERAQTAVYFDSGQLIYAASNLRTLRLREYLIKRGTIAEKDFASLKNNPSDLALAAALSAGGTLSEKDVDSLISTLVADVLRVALLWTEGAWQFTERARLAEPVRAQIDTDSLLRETAQRMPLMFVSQRLGNSNEIMSRAAQVSPTSNFSPIESFVLSRLDSPMSLADLVVLSGLPELDAYRVIYGLALSGFIKREHWQNAFRAGLRKSNEQPGSHSTPEAPAREKPTESRWTSASDEEGDLEKFLLRLRQATNYYEIMELPPTAEANVIKDAYYALARRYHPDRFHLKSGTQLHAELSSAFARITQAYETLTNPNARFTYDQSLERSRRLSEPASRVGKVESNLDSAADFEYEPEDSEAAIGNAEYNFRAGLLALKEGRVNAATTYLAAAARLAPQEARYRAYYGHALAASETTRRLAENEIQAAVKLDPGSANFRTMLAELYYDLKFHKRAQTEVERALTIDPHNGPARALLRKLEKSRRVG